MSPKQQTEEAQVKKIIEREWTIFRHDEAMRCTTRAELVAALRKLKTRLTLQLKAQKHLQWVHYTVNFIDEKIAALVEDQPLAVKKEALSEKPPKAKFWLPKVFRKKSVD